MPSRPTSPIITLLTDFGLADHFVGVLKGVIAGIAPKSEVIDISHEVTAYEVGQARFLLSQSWPYFPKGTVHLCIVDPGVGSSRRGLVVEAEGHQFVGPDNGLFTDILAVPKMKVRQILNAKLFLKNVSQTFHGRDIFAPVAAHLAAGLAFAKAGPLVSDAMRLGSGKPMRTGRRFWTGEVVHVDRFGNLITNLSRNDFPGLSDGCFLMRVGYKEIRSLYSSYSAAPDGEAFAIEGSSGNLEIALKQAAASKALGVGIGSPVELEIF